MRLMSLGLSLALALFVSSLTWHTATPNGAAVATPAISQHHLSALTPEPSHGETSEQSCLAYCALAACSVAAVGASSVSAEVTLPVCGRIVLPVELAMAGQMPEPGWRPPIFS